MDSSMGTEFHYLITSGNSLKMGDRWINVKGLLVNMIFVSAERDCCCTRKALQQAPTNKTLLQ